MKTTKLSMIEEMKKALNEKGHNFIMATDGTLMVNPDERNGLMFNIEISTLYRFTPNIMKMDDPEIQQNFKRETFNIITSEEIIGFIEWSYEQYPKWMADIRFQLGLTSPLSEEMNEILSALKKEIEMDSEVLNNLPKKEQSIVYSKMSMIEIIESRYYKDEDIKKMVEIVKTIELFYADTELDADMDVIHSLLFDGGGITIESHYLDEDEHKSTYIDFKNGNFVMDYEEIKDERFTAQILLNNIELELFGVH